MNFRSLEIRMNTPAGIFSTVQYLVHLYFKIKVPKIILYLYLIIIYYIVDVFQNKSKVLVYFYLQF